MADVQNTRDQILQSAGQRLQIVETAANTLSSATRSVRVSVSAPVFTVDKDSVATPTAITLTVNLTSFPPNQLVTWSVVSGSATLTPVSAYSVSIAPGTTSDVVKIRALAVYLGSSYEEVTTISKVYAGVDGVAPTLFAVKPSATSVVVNALGQFNYSSITLAAYKKETASGAVTAYSGRFQVSAVTVGGLVTLYTSSVDEPSATFSLISGTKDVVIRLFRAGGLTEELDRSNVPVLQDGVDIAVRVESTNGTVFRVGQARNTTLIARVFRNAVEITDEIPAHRFRWIRVSLDNQPPPNDDATWNASHASGFKQVSLNVDAVYAKATFHCQIIE